MGARWSARLIDFACRFYALSKIQGTGQRLGVFEHSLATLTSGVRGSPRQFVGGTSTVRMPCCNHDTSCGSIKGVSKRLQGANTQFWVVRNQRTRKTPQRRNLMVYMGLAAHTPLPWCSHSEQASVSRQNARSRRRRGLIGRYLII